MKAIKFLLDKARENPKRIVFPEGNDPRIIKAASQLANDGIAHPILLGEKDVIEAQAIGLGVSLNRIELIETKQSKWRSALVTALHALRKHKGVTLEKAQQMVHEPLNFAAMMVREGHADGMVAGAVNATADVVRTSIQLLGVAKDANMVSSFFIMMMCEAHHAQQGAMIFSDCGLVIDPDENELTEITLAAANSMERVLEKTPRIAMLSFSTNRSANHPKVDKVRQATEQVRARRPNLIIDGELQLDAALVRAIAERKLDDSQVQGDANVLIFPSLEAGNIGYKLAERIGGAKAFGPLLQGLAYPANDLSRGCDEEDIYHVAAITVIQAQHQQEPSA